MKLIEGMTIDNIVYKKEIDDIIKKLNEVYEPIKDGIVTDISFIKLTDVYDINKDDMTEIYYKEIHN